MYKWAISALYQHCISIVILSRPGLLKAGMQIHSDSPIHLKPWSLPLWSILPIFQNTISPGKLWKTLPNLLGLQIQQRLLEKWWHGEVHQTIFARFCCALLSLRQVHCFPQISRNGSPKKCIGHCFFSPQRQITWFSAPGARANGHHSPDTEMWVVKSTFWALPVPTNQPIVIGGKPFHITCYYIYLYSPSVSLFATLQHKKYVSICPICLIFHPQFRCSNESMLALWALCSLRGPNVTELWAQSCVMSCNA